MFLCEGYHRQFNHYRTCSIKKISVKEQKLRTKPWTTKGILTSINNKNKTYRKYCHAKNQTRRDQLHNLFKNYHNSINKIIKVSKAKHYHQYFHIKFGKELKKLYTVNQTQVKLSTCSELMVAFLLIKTKLPIHLIHFFCNIPKEIEKTLIPATSSFSRYLANSANNSLFMRSTDEMKLNNK